jgi:hypothetical protein
MRAHNQRIPKVVVRVFVVALRVLGGIIGALLAFDVWIAKTVRGKPRSRQTASAGLHAESSGMPTPPARSRERHTLRMRSCLVWDVAVVRGTRLVVQSLCGLGLVGRGPL